MPTPIAETILAALEALLATVPSVAAAHVYRDRDARISTLPALVLTDEGDAVDETVGLGVELHTMQVIVTGYAEGASGEAVGASLSTLLADTRKALLSGDRRPGGALDVRDAGYSTALNPLEGQKPHKSFTLALDVDYTTATGDPYTAAG